jgi:cytochrome c556
LRSSHQLTIFLFAKSKEIGEETMIKAIHAAAVAGFLALGFTAAVAEGDPIADRKAVLKGFGDASKAPGAMMKGEAPFDLAAVKKALDTYEAGAKKLPSLFPDNSKTGGETGALPKIWEEKSKFDGLFAKLAADAAAAKAAITDEASFKANVGKVFGNCKACHDDFRAKKS